MLERLKDVISEHKLLNPGTRVLVAVSGGVDSVALAHLFTQLPYPMAIAHMNYQLRGTASERDEELVVALGKQWGVETFTKRVEAATYAKSKGQSIQMAARDLRYEWMDQLSKHHGYDRILTAHHANDSLETILFNLSKGTGLKGLTGIAIESGKVGRPLVLFSRAEIVKYARSEQLTWREDESNNDPKYQRNKVRHQVIPVLNEINPALIRHFHHTRQRLEGAALIMQQRVDEVRSKFLSQADEGRLTLGVEWISGLTSDLVILSELLAPFGFSYRDTLDMARAVNAQSGKRFLSDSHEVTTDRGKWIIQKKEAAPNERIVVERDLECAYIAGKRITFSETGDINFPGTQDEAWLDLDKLDFPMELRTWEEGDRFQPLGMTGMKKVSDFLIDEKVPLPEKSRILVMLSGGEVCWLVGHRLDERFKVSDQTRHVFKVTCGSPT